jgi:hypothetical protein
MKAFQVCDNPEYDGWELFHAETRNQARYIGAQNWYTTDTKYYTEMRARRMPKLDGLAFTDANVRATYPELFDPEYAYSNDFCDCDICKAAR